MGSFDPRTSRRSETEKFDKKKEKKESITVITHYSSAVCWADTPGPIPIKFGMHVTPHDVIKVSNFW